ncbi:class I SAM-dependent methyltransferase [bacterium]|nr:class I SAM-dependent methyltransferase [bacterium]
MPWDPDEPFPSSASLGETDSGARNLPDFLCSFLVPGEVLAIGSSEAALYAARHHDVTAVDWNRRRLHRLMETAQLRGLELRAACRDPQRQDLEVVKGGVANVLCVDVLERVSSDLALLQKLHRALRPDGVLVARVPACDWIRPEGGGHVPCRGYDEGSLREVLEEAGFTLLRLRKWNFVGVSSALVWDLCLGRPHRYRGGIPSAERPRSRWDTLLDSWYRTVEDRVAFPVGTSLVAVARPGRARTRARDLALGKGLARRPQTVDPLSFRRLSARPRQTT